MEQKETTPKAEMKRRFRHVFLNVIEILSVGLAYYLLTRIFKVGLPCPIYALFGKYCPGCGISRMCAALLHLDFRTAFLNNRFLFVISPILLIHFIRKSYIYIRKGVAPIGKIETIVTLILAISAIVFAVMRNMEQFAYLRPMV